MDFLQAIRQKVKDAANELFKTAVISAAVYNAPNTTFTVDNTEGFLAGDTVYFKNATGVKTIISVDSTLLKIVIAGDLVSGNPSGTEFFKTDSIQHLDEALQVYSLIRPRRLSQDYPYESDAKYAMPTGWQIDFSQIIDIESPIDQLPREIISDNYYTILYDANGVPYIFAPNAGIINSMRVQFTKMHGFGVENPPQVTTSDAAFYCICNIASARYLLALASFYGQGTSPTISADSTDTTNKVDAYRRLAKEYLGAAAQFLGVSIKELESGSLNVGGASVDQEIETLASDKGRLMKNSLTIIN